MNEGVNQRSASYGIEDFCETFERTVNPVMVSSWEDYADIIQPCIN
jgi:hypothetical protein